MAVGCRYRALKADRAAAAGGLGAPQAGEVGVQCPRLRAEVA